MSELLLLSGLLSDDTPWLDVGLGPATQAAATLPCSGVTAWRALVGFGRVDLGETVLEVGGTGALNRSIAAVGRGGRVALIGLLTGFEGAVNPYGLLDKQASICGVLVGYRYLESGAHFGKVVLRI